jgi:4-hydroxybenzoate polyprenyltransferase
MQSSETAAASHHGAWRRVVLTLDMIKFEHTIFALPFALTGALLAWRELGFPLAILPGKLLWIIVAMAGARSAAMAFNRIVDASIDARNPRTASRHLPAGLLTRQFAVLFTLVAIAVFLYAAYRLGPLCWRLAPAALAVVLGYSWTKRFTALSHLVLGFALGIAPAAAWIAMTGSLDPRILWLTAAVMLWTAGFDIIYACQDAEFDRREGLHSLPSRLGLRNALRVSRLLHIGMAVCLSALGLTLDMGAAAWAGVALVAALLAWEHRLVRHDDLSRVNAAFFTMNGYVSMLFFVFWAVDLLVFRRDA